MWRNIFLSIIIIFGIITSTKSAVIECYWIGDQCFSITSITPVTQPNEPITVAGKPSNYVNKDKDSFALLDCVLNYLPPAIFTVFPNISSFSINNCQKTTLAANPNLNCGHLSTFFIYNGIILNIPEGFLQTCSQLSILNLGGNRIETIDKNAFKGLTKLDILELPNNNLTCIPTELFKNLPLLRSINLSFNKFKAINSEIFKDIPSLMYVIFSYNLLEYLPTLNLNGTSSQTPSYINFENNPIYALSPDFTSIFLKRGSVAGFSFVLTNARCLTTDYYVLHQTNYMDSGPYLQNCYKNWTSSMTGNIVCGQSSVTTTTTAPSCPISSFWQQLLDYLKSLKLI